MRLLAFIIPFICITGTLFAQYSVVPKKVILVEGDEYIINLDDSPVTYIAGQKSIATCTNEGVIVANKPGNTRIKIKGNKKKITIKVKVLPKKSIKKTGDFPILAWYSLQDDVSHELYQEIAEAGFNLSFSEATDSIVPLMKRAIKEVDGTGIKLLIPFRGLWIDVKPIVNYFKDEGNLWGWYIYDEPSYNQFPKIKEFINKIKAIDSKHPFYVNLYPLSATNEQLGNVTYEKYVSSFIEDLTPPIISFDNYPIRYNRIKVDFFKNLNIISSYSISNNIPFWAFACCVKYGEHVPEPRLEHIKLEVYSALAYGAQGIEYFTYTTPRMEHGGNHFWNAPIDKNGNKTETYSFVKEVNYRIRSIESFLLNSKPKFVGSIGEKAIEGVEKYLTKNLPQGIYSIESSQTLLTSWLVKDSTSVFLMVNTNIESIATVRLNLSDKISKLSKDGQLVTASPVESILPGDMLTYVIKN